jgi:hypothetical protein
MFIKVWKRFLFWVILLHSMPPIIFLQDAFQNCSPIYVQFFLAVHFYLDFRPKSYIHPSIHYHACYIIFPSHPPLLGHSIYIWCRA